MKSATIIKLAFIFTLAVTLSACSKKLNSEGCPTNQMCTMEFATLGVQFVDGAGNAVAVKNVTVTNKRTNKPIVANNDAPASGNYVIVTDANKKELSTTGDDVEVTAVSTDGRTKTVVYKISGGCNCHVKIISGDTKVVF